MMHSTPIPPQVAEPVLAEEAALEKPVAEKRVPGERTCAGCGEKAQGKDLLRVVMGPWNGTFAEVAIDFANGAIGRGAHVHPTVPCLEKAVKSGFSKSFKSKIKASTAELSKEIVLGSERAIIGLVTAAVARRRAAIGADACKEAMKADGARFAPLLLVASDAGSITSEFHAYADEGRVSVFGDKKVLGKLCGKSEVAVLAITDENISSAIVRATTMAGPFRGPSGSEACMSPEVR